MNITFTSDIEKNYDAIILGVYEKSKLSKFTESFDKKLGGVISKTIKNSKFSGNVGDVVDIFSEKIILVGLGKETELNEIVLHKIGGIIGSHISKVKKENVLLK